MFSKINGTLLYQFSSLVYRTCRFYIDGKDQMEEVKHSEEPIIVTSWHGMTMMVAGYLRKNLDLANFDVIMPDDHRGDTLKVFARFLGAKPLVLDLEEDFSFQSGRKLITLIKDIKAGRNLLIHPDGPAGPAYQVKPGLAFVARKTGTRILPLGCYCRHAYHIPRWDRYTLPLPFSKIQIQVGKLITLPEGEGDQHEIKRRLENTLNRLTFQAAANYYPAH